MSVTEKTIAVVSILRPEGETGVQTHFNLLLNYLKELGLAADRITPFSCSPLLRPPIFAVRKLFIGPLAWLSALWYRYWHCLFLRRAIDLTYPGGNDPIFYAQCPLAAKAAFASKAGKRGARVFMAVHFNVSQAEEFSLKGEILRGGRVYRAIQKTEQEVLEKLTGIIYVSKKMKECVEARIPAAKERPNLVVPNWTVKPVGKDGEPRGDLISIGTLEPRKNQQFLLRVVGAARAQGYSYRLTLIGQGPCRRSLQRLSLKLGIADLVFFAGYKKDVAPLLTNHRAYAHGALYESFGIVLIEALSCGKPLFAAPVGGIPEIFEDGVEGCYWNLEAPEEAASRLIAVLEDEERYRKMSAAAFRRHSERFTPELNAPRLLDFLRSTPAG